jgi:predicted oxidoreductase
MHGRSNITRCFFHTLVRYGGIKSELFKLSIPNLKLSPIVAGCWRMDAWGWTAAQRLDWIEACIDLGITSFDHADIYGGYSVEALFGEALARKPALRQKLQLVSKCGIQLVSPQRPQHRLKAYDTSAMHIEASVDQSLRALKTDHLDLLLIHRPDPLLDADVVAETFQRLHRSGKAGAFGVSNFTPAQFALLHSRTPLVTNQVECSPLHLAPLHDGTFDQAQRLRLAPMIWSPLAGGRVFTGEDAAARRVRATLSLVATRLSVSMATVLYAWLRRLPCGPHPIVGSSRTEVLREAIAALDTHLDASTWHEIWSAGAGHEVP